ncbi:MAG TPA: hypothetical protein VGM82_04860 [Gemmatimonadaceae bacterium]
MSGIFSRMRDAITGHSAANEPVVYDVRGFTVVVDNTRPDIRTEDVLERLDESLAMIEQYQPWRLAHLRRDLSHFIVARFACRGAFFPDQRACMTELTFLARRDITFAPVASSILHEGMHARVHAMGVDPHTRDRAREERLCRRVELEFGLSLPRELGAPVIERARASLELDDEGVAPTVDWAEAQRRIQAVDNGQSS